MTLGTSLSPPVPLFPMCAEGVMAPDTGLLGQRQVGRRFVPLAAGEDKSCRSIAAGALPWLSLRGAFSASSLCPGLFAQGIVHWDGKVW